MSPVQATIVPVADRHISYAEQVAAAFTAAPLRVEVDAGDDTVGEKIRRAMTHHHPAVVVVGDDDIASGTVGLRLRGEQADDRGVDIDDAVARLVEICRPPR